MEIRRHGRCRRRSTHVAWSVNSLCHLVGNRPFSTRRHDRATNLWPLALVSLGESWHKMHHSDPTCARHGDRLDARRNQGRRQRAVVRAVAPPVTATVPQSPAVRFIHI